MTTGWAMLQGLGLVAGLWLAAVLAAAALCRRSLAAIWREPVLRQPVLVIESDDWGAGPLEQAGALRALAQVLRRHRDAAGRPAQLSLALVLAVPRTPAAPDGGPWRRVELDDPRFAGVLGALREGVADGVFVLHLHAHEHCWPAALAHSPLPAVQAWLRGAFPVCTEALPAPLQSRWVDASTLPSRALEAGAVGRAVAEEAAAFAGIVGRPARLVVPPTFVWTREVEAAWAAAGIECVVTPGWRHRCRGADGLPAGDEGPLVNGDADPRTGLGYLARCDHFEPRRGRDAAHALRALDAAVAQGRPCLLENHRDNFLGEPAACRHGLEELDRLLGTALARHRDLRFADPLELCRALRRRDPSWVVTGWQARLPALWRRLQGSGRPWRLARLAGLAPVGGALVRWLSAARPTPRPDGQPETP